MKQESRSRGQWRLQLAARASRKSVRWSELTSLCLRVLGRYKTYSNVRGYEINYLRNWDIETDKRLNLLAEILTYGFRICTFKKSFDHKVFNEDCSLSSAYWMILMNSHFEILLQLINYHQLSANRILCYIFLRFSTFQHLVVTRYHWNILPSVYIDRYVPRLDL